MDRLGSLLNRYPMDRLAPEQAIDGWLQTGSLPIKSCWAHEEEGRTYLCPVNAAVKRETGDVLWAWDEDDILGQRYQQASTTLHAPHAYLRGYVGAWDGESLLSLLTTELRGEEPWCSPIVALLGAIDARRLDRKLRKAGLVL